jgi:hypothetical protein
MIAPVFTKQRNYDLWQGGVYGTKLRSWRTFYAYQLSGFPGRVVLRQLSVGADAIAYDLTPTQSLWVYREMTDNLGIDPGQIMVNEMAPDHLSLLQGEYLNDVINDQVTPLFYSRSPLSMRMALHSPDRKHATGLVANTILRELMTPGSWDDWCTLLENFPKHVLEVSIYDCEVGDIPGRNALVWEVRRY